MRTLWLLALVACSRDKQAPVPASSASPTPVVVAVDAKPPPIRFTAVAAAKIREIRAAEGLGAEMRLRLEVRDSPSAPAGFEYNLYFDEKKPGDRELDADGIAIVLDAHSFAALDGTEVDFIETPQGAGFKYNNPNVRQ